MPLGEPKSFQDQRPFLTWLNALKAWARQFRIIESADIKPSIGPEGTLLTIKTRAGSGTSTPAGTFRGEWKSGLAYSEGDMVIRGSNNAGSTAWNAADAILGDGGLAGLYEATQDVPSSVLVAGVGRAIAPTEPQASVTPDGGVATYYWRTVARFGTHIMAIRASGAATKIYLDATAPNGAVSLKLSDCNGKSLSVREINVCVGGDPTYRMMVLGSAPYRP